MTVSRKTFCVLIMAIAILGFLAEAKAEEDASPFDKFLERYEYDDSFRSYVSIGAVVLGLIVLTIVLSFFLGIELQTSFSIVLAGVVIIVIGILAVLSYGGKSAQTLDSGGSQEDGQWHRTDDGWTRSGERDFRGGYMDSSGKIYENP